MGNEELQVQGSDSEAEQVEYELEMQDSAGRSIKITKILSEQQAEEVTLLLDQFINIELTSEQAVALASALSVLLNESIVVREEMMSDGEVLGYLTVSSQTGITDLSGDNINT